MYTENLYLIELSNKNERFYKIGTTVHRYCRFYQIMKHGYSAKIVFMLFGLDPFIAWEYERLLQCSFDKYRPKIKFGGYTECVNPIDLNRYKDIVSCLKPSEVVENIDITWR